VNLKTRQRNPTQSEQQKEKRRKKNEGSLRDIWKDNIKQTNICIMGVPGEEERVKRAKKFI